MSELADNYKQMKQREIKFRAWDKENRKIYYWDSVDHPAIKDIEGTPDPKLFYLPMSYLMGDSNDWVWLQYTGLKDKHNKEIYEGDILLLYYGEKEKVEIPDIYFMDAEGNIEDSEIIGNVYENPELLK